MKDNFWEEVFVALMFIFLMVFLCFGFPILSQEL